MKKMLALTGIAMMMAVTASFAGDGKTFDKKVVVVPETCKFRDMEFQIDAFYTGFASSRGALQTGSGGGFGLNFFFARYFGIGYEAAWYSNDGNGAKLPVGGNLFFRYPICSWNLAPYVMVGGGAAWSSAWDGTVGYGNVGGGLEYRLTDHIGLFGDSRWFYGNQSTSAANFRAGLRYAF